MRKLALSQYYLDTQIDEKKILIASFNPIIKDTKKKISAYANALKNNSIDCLDGVVYEGEFSEISDIKNGE